MTAGQRMLQLGTREGDFALFLLRIFRSLDALVGGDEAKARAWLSHDNLHLGGVPLALLQRLDGIVHVAEYLDAMRAKVSVVHALSLCAVAPRLAIWRPA